MAEIIVDKFNLETKEWETLKIFPIAYRVTYVIHEREHVVYTNGYTLSDKILTLPESYSYDGKNLTVNIERKLYNIPVIIDELPEQYTCKIHGKIFYSLNKLTE